MKKTLILVLCFALLACALCGCGKKSDNWLTIKKGILHVEIPMEEGVTWEDSIDDVFRAAAECAEEAVLNSMLCAHTVTGWSGETIYSLADLWEKTGL